MTKRSKGSKPPYTCPNEINYNNYHNANEIEQLLFSLLSIRDLINEHLHTQSKEYTK